MLCQRCSHPLPPLKGRCLRCFALNPAEKPLAPPMSFASDPPPPVMLELGEEAHGQIDWHRLPTDPHAQPLSAPPPARPSWAPAHPIEPVEPPTDEFALPAEARPARQEPPAPGRPASETRVPASAQLFAWTVDFAVLALCTALHVGLATWLFGAARIAPEGASADYWLDLLLRGPRLPLFWTAQASLLAVAYSWLFAVLGGRTPGLALAGLRLKSLRGGSLTVSEALARAAIAVPSAALGLSGFALALLDPRGQTLHDKLAGAVLVRAQPR